MVSPSASPGMGSDLTLRAIAVFSSVVGGILVPIAGIANGRVLPFLGLIPLGMSILLSLATLASKYRPIPHKPYADLVVAVVFALFLIPSFVAQAEHNFPMNMYMLLLWSYSTMPMIVNFCIHTYFVLRALPSPEYLIANACSNCRTTRSCPNCKHTIPPILPRWQGHIALRTNAEEEQRNQIAIGQKGSTVHREVYPSFMRHHSGDADARESSEFQTSCCNTPRQSADTLRSEARSSREGGIDRRNVGSLV